MKRYKLITWYNVLGVHECKILGYKIARQNYERDKENPFICAAVLVNPKGKVMHIFDHTKNFEYRGGISGDWFAPIGKNNRV
ncbi:hypothetical protein [Lactococcus phage Nocturne116]|nr:hypothetical protein [Lactococcus phage Nocturne116]